MSFLPAITSWLQRNRTSVRMAFILRMAAMGVGSIFGLIWTRLLLHAMGDQLLGLFQSFQAFARLGGLGDLGITGALSLRVGILLGSRDDAGLRKLLASARTLFLVLAAGLCLLFIGSSPWMPRWLNYDAVPNAGSMVGLFVYGGLSMGLFIIGGYFASLNYAYGTVTWPILPSVVFVQILAPFFHWRLAVIHMPLWVQLLPYLVSGLVTVVLGRSMLKWSYPLMGELRPLEIDRREWKTLSGISGWMYLVSIGAAIYFSTDLLVIGKVIGTAVLPTYSANVKVCDLAMTLIVTAAFVSFPKITQWISSPDRADRERLLVELHRLSIFEVVLCCGGVLGYLAFNNLFVGLWLDKNHQAPLALQVAFACNLAVTVGGNAGIQTSMRTGNKGLKRAALTIAGIGLLNLGLSYLAVKFGYLAGDKFGSLNGVTAGVIGVAVATVIAQSISSLCLGSVTCRYLKLSVLQWAARCWVLPITFTLVAALIKNFWPQDSVKHLSLVSACYVVLFLLVCRVAGMNFGLIESEIRQVRGMFSRR